MRRLLATGGGVGGGAVLLNGTKQRTIRYFLADFPWYTGVAKPVPASPASTLASHTPPPESLLLLCLTHAGFRPRCC